MQTLEVYWCAVLCRRYALTKGVSNASTYHGSVYIQSHTDIHRTLQSYFSFGWFSNWRQIASFPKRTSRTIPKAKLLYTWPVKASVAIRLIPLPLIDLYTIYQMMTVFSTTNPSRIHADSQQETAMTRQGTASRTAGAILAS